MKKILMGFVVFFGISFGFLAFAQFPVSTEPQSSVADNTQKNKLPPISFVPISPKIEGTVNCFDYYKFGSMQVDVSSTQNTINPGETLKLTGKIINNNSYPIVDGQVYVKVFKNKNYKKNSHNNGPDLIDQFFTKENISIGAGEQKDIEFNWKVPGNAASGEYRLSTYFTVDNKFNLLGLSFTDDITGNIYDFTVKGSSNPTVEFNKNTVKVEDKEYYFAAFTPQVSKDQDVHVNVDLSNFTGQTSKIPVTWTLYSWDGINPKNVVDEKKESVTLNPKETKNLEYIVKDKNHNVYFLVAKTENGESKSILDIRFLRPNIDQVRINFPSVTSFPLKKDQSNSLFSCVHGTGNATLVKNNKFVLTLLDKNGGTIFTKSYETDITGAMMGLKSDFTPKENYDKFTLKAELFHENKLIDSSLLEYDCKNINPNLCLPENEKNGAVAKKVMNGIYVLLVCLFIAVISFIFFKKKNSTFKAFLFLVFSSAMFFSFSSFVEAKSVTWTNQLDKKLYYRANGISGLTGSGWGLGLVNPGYQTTYKAKVFNADTGVEILDGAQIPVGTKLFFKYGTFDDQDVSWWGTGYSYDSPYGKWIGGAGMPSDFDCTNDYYHINDSNFTSPQGYTYYFNVYIPFSINPPQKSITHSRSSATLSNCNLDKSICTVASPGQIITDFNFGDTFGKFYYAYNMYSPYDFCGYTGYSLRTVNSDEYSQAYMDYVNYCLDPDCQYVIDSSDFSVNFPAQTITYTLNAITPIGVPVAFIDQPANGSEIEQGAIQIAGRGTDTDGTIVAYEWRDGSETGGLLSNASQFTKSDYALGSHALFFRVQDDKGNWSSWTSSAFTVVPAKAALNVVINGQDLGNVTGGGIDCGKGKTDCSKKFEKSPATVVTLTASADEFKGWGGSCSGTNTSCNVTMNEARTVIANFGCIPQDCDSESSKTNREKVCIGEMSVDGNKCGYVCNGTKDCTSWREVGE